MFNYLDTLSSLELFFLVIGFFGQGVFASRFIVQWIYSKKKGDSSQKYEYEVTHVSKLDL